MVRIAAYHGVVRTEKPTKARTAIHRNQRCTAERVRGSIRGVHFYQQYKVVRLHHPFSVLAKHDGGGADHSGDYIGNWYQSYREPTVLGSEQRVHQHRAAVQF